MLDAHVCLCLGRVSSNCQYEAGRVHEAQTDQDLFVLRGWWSLHKNNGAYQACERKMALVQEAHNSVFSRV